MTDSESILGQTVSHYRVAKKLGGGGMGVVYQYPVAVEYPAWTSDSHHVEHATDFDIKRIKVGESHPEALFNTKALHQYSTPDFGTWTDNAPDNSRMFLRDASTSRLYTLDVKFP